MKAFTRKTLSLLLALFLMVSLVTPAVSALPLDNQQESTPKLDPSSPTYAQDKLDYIKSRQTGDAPLLYGTEPGYFSTSYIQGYVHQNGKFNIGTADGDCLLFSYPGGETSETLIRINSIDYRFHNYVTDITFSDDRKSCIATAEIGDITVKQILSIVRNPNSTSENVVSIQYMLENNSSSAVDVGVRIMMDTMLGSNDGAPFRVNGANITTEREFIGNAIPQVYQATDSLSDPNLTATGYFYFSGSEKPDKVQFAYWGDISGSSWDYQIINGRILTNDSAVAVYFNEKSLPSYSCRSVVTYYGAYENDSAAAYDPFPYDNNVYNQELAELCAGYSALAYQDYKYDAVNDVYYNNENNGKTDTEKNNRSKVLNDRLTQDGFLDIHTFNYNTHAEDNATFTLAHKSVNVNGTSRDLITVVIRGTNMDEWKGNMNVTGYSYNSMAEHYSFRNGANQIIDKLSRYLVTYDRFLDNPMVLITGHSRGAAIGNLLAVDLTQGAVSGIDSNSVYAYLFAVPNATTDYDTSYTNIYNFCFTDDFVTCLPLNSKWNYGKHGTTYTISADSLSTSSAFYKKQEKSKSLTDGNGVSFDQAETSAVIKHVASNWGTVNKYYTKEAGLGGGAAIQTLYQFMHDIVAPAAMGDGASKVLLKSYCIATSFSKIANFFADGFKMRQSIFDTHNMFTYYNALVTGSFPTGTAASVSAPALNAPTLNADPANAELEQAALEAFANTEGNLDILGWNLSDTASWDGITWDENGRVASISLAYQGLTGTLDLTSFDCLTEADVSGNDISGLILPDSETSVLTWLDCGHNKLTTLDILGQPLEVLICSNNYLDPDAIAEAAASVAFSSCGSQKPTVDIPYSATDVAALKDKVLTNSDLWDLTAEPESWIGVTWENFEGEYRVTRLDIANCNLSGALDVSALSKLQSLNCSGNSLTSIDASLCNELTFLNCNNNQITNISLSVSANLYMLSCSDNCLNDKSSAGLKADNINLGHQYVNAPVSSFCPAEYAILSPIAEALGEDLDAPGTWSFVTWIPEEALYHASKLDLAYQLGLSGELDLTGFEYLEELNCAGTPFQSVILPESMTAIGDRAFFGCTALEEVTFPATLQNVGTRAFDTCLGLEHVYFPSSLASISNGAFRLCANLRAAYFTGNAPECGSNAFMYTSVAFTIYHLADTTGWDNEVWNSYIVDTLELFSIKTYPTKMNYYVNEELDLTGLELLKLNPNGTFEEITSGYTVQCDDMSTPGEKTVTVTYNGDSTSFIIIVTQPSITDFYIYMESYRLDYTGSALEPTVYIERHDGTHLTEGTDYTVSYSNNTGPGYAEVTVTGINQYSGSYIMGFEIIIRETITVTDWTELESQHNYSDSCEITWIYNAKNEDTQHIQLTFDPQTEFESGCDYLVILDGDGNQVGRYSGTQLAGRTIYVSGTSVQLILTTDPSVTFWGFKVTDLQEKNTPVPASQITRLYGQDRIATSLAIANEQKQIMGIRWFRNIVVASATNFPDALTGSYLAARMNAPILLTYDAVQEDIINYIAANLETGGTVFILGGTSAVNESFEDDLAERGIFGQRLAGNDRIETNLEILAHAGVYSNAPVLICTAFGFADSLSASATGLPILLVGNSLTQAQKDFLAATSREFIIIGGTSAVSAAVEAELGNIGSVYRLSGASRYQTSVMVADAFFGNPSAAVLAYAQNYPDGLCGGPLAYLLNAPLILTDNRNPSAADAFIESTALGYVVGGSGLISDDTASNIFDLDET